MLDSGSRTLAWRSPQGITATSMIRCAPVASLTISVMPEKSICALAIRPSGARLRPISRAPNAAARIPADNPACPLNGADVYRALERHKVIVMACNIRIPLVIPGIMRAAKELVGAHAFVSRLTSSVSPDEMTLAAMTRHAIAGDRPGFDAALAGFVFDLDGCVWNGDVLNPGAAEVLARLHAKGRRLAFVSNNSRARCASSPRASTRSNAPCSAREKCPTLCSRAARFPASSFPCGSMARATLTAASQTRCR